MIKGYVTKGNFLIVEDTCVKGHPIYPEHGPGPMEAIEKFLSSNDEFEIEPGVKGF